MTTATDAEVPTRLREWRMRRAWTQDDVAEQMAERGFTSWRQTTVSKTEQGARPLLLSEAIGLCRILRISLGELVES